jgi:hypothetical protein
MVTIKKLWKNCTKPLNDLRAELVESRAEAARLLKGTRYSKCGKEYQPRLGKYITHKAAEAGRYGAKAIHSYEATLS